MSKKDKWDFKDVYDKKLPNLGDKKRKNLQEQYINGREFYTDEEYDKMVKKTLKMFKLPK